MCQLAEHTLPLRSPWIAVDTTVADVQQLLSGHGATAVMVEYDQGEAVTLQFKIMVDGEALGYRLPVNWQSVLGGGCAGAEWGLIIMRHDSVHVGR